ncbi:piRNA biogenesis protein EXD1-like [Zootermopsis nevadensis]|uniref:Exonuclease 3'-5' domain-containing protein 1 n=1 Tax=Zootermopsis nevadensis TaxID=136037 RepID=A0A067R1Q8_ZOONE|nr:piRNA biogenesis protein EXD1-like [Zootermopsis nevadensis]KDR15932.1 Exonuclease 3'-5' domain-containing protein 1 [Zootermopsis nevadensis]
MDPLLNGDFKGEKIFFETENVTVEGIVDSFDHGNNMITMKRAVHYPLGKEFHGEYHFYINEAKRIYILKYVKHAESEEIMEKSGCSRTPSHLQNKWHSCGIDHFLTAEEYDTLIGVADGAILIDCIDKFFNKAIEAIKNEAVIGIDATGASSVGMSYQVTLLSIAIQMCVYQFDIQKLGMAAFDAGLRSVLESKVQKVIHDSRLLSACLYHKYWVRIDNVFDTQVGELMIEKNSCGKFPKYVCSLPECVKIFLGIPPAVVQFNKNDTVWWTKRPLLQSLKCPAARNAVFLLPLQQRIKAKMFSPVTQGINIFLKAVRDAGNDEANLHIGNNHLVPQEFLMLESTTTQM